MFVRLLIRCLWYIKRTFVFSFGHISIMAEWKTDVPINWKQYRCNHEISYSDYLKYNIETKSTITGVALSWGGVVYPSFFWEKTCPFCESRLTSRGYYSSREINRIYKPEGDSQWPIYPETGEKIPRRVEGF